jgi:hypothetical protein
LTLSAEAYIIPRVLDGAAILLPRVVRGAGLGIGGAAHSPTVHNAPYYFGRFTKQLSAVRMDDINNIYTNRQSSLDSH